MQSVKLRGFRVQGLELELELRVEGGGFPRALGLWDDMSIAIPVHVQGL